MDFNQFANLELQLLVNIYMIHKYWLSYNVFFASCFLLFVLVSFSRSLKNFCLSEHCFTDKYASFHVSLVSHSAFVNFCFENSVERSKGARAKKNRKKDARSTLQMKLEENRHVQFASLLCIIKECIIAKHYKIVQKFKYNSFKSTNSDICNCGCIPIFTSSTENL